MKNTELDDQHNEWEVHDAAKMGFLNKLGDWNSTTFKLLLMLKVKTQIVLQLFIAHGLTALHPI